VSLRPAVPADVPLILTFIQELAAYERAPDAVKMTAPQLHGMLFGEPARAEALIAEVDNVAVGFAVWFESFNTWTGRPGLYVEDVFIRPEARQHGLGKQIFVYLARLAMARDYARMEWMVLDWNQPAIRFYTSLGAKPLPDWTKYRLSGAELLSLATN
jgi:GNAT superfamily N-acetyltransferase